MKTRGHSEIVNLLNTAIVKLKQVEDIVSNNEFLSVEEEIKSLNSKIEKFIKMIQHTEMSFSQLKRERKKNGRWLDLITQALKAENRAMTATEIALKIGSNNEALQGMSNRSLITTISAILKRAVDQGKLVRDFEKESKQYLYGSKTELYTKLIKKMPEKAKMASFS